MKQKEFFSSTMAKLKEFERELGLIKDPVQLGILQHQAAEWATLTLPRIEDHLAVIRDEFTAQYRRWFGVPPPDAPSMVPRIVPTHEFRSDMGHFGARLMEGFEAAFNTWLAVKVWAVNDSWVAVAGITLATLAFCEGVGRLLATHLNKRTEVPAESRQRSGRLLVPTLGTWLLFFFLTYVVRTATGGIADVLGPVISLIFAGVEITTLVLVAIGFAVHELYGWSARDAAEYSRYLDMHTRVAALIIKGGGQKRAAEVSSQPAPSPVATGVLTVVMMLVAAYPASSYAQASLSTARTSQYRQIALSEAEPAGCTFADVSTSVLASARAASLENHREAVTLTMQKLGISSWCFVQFTADGWDAPPVTVAQTTSNTRAACAPPGLSEAGKLFTPRHDQEVNDAAQRCRTAQGQALAEMRVSINTSIDMLLKQNAPRPSRCSSVLDTIERAARMRELRASTIITDGRENCGAWRQIAAPDSGAQVVVILVPSVDDAGKRTSGGALFAERKAQLLKAAPWLTVIPAFELSSNTFRASTSAALAKR